MIRCVAFDFDGTLVQSNAIKADSFLAVADTIPGGLAVMTSLRRRLVNADRYQMFDSFVREMGIPQDQQAETSRDLAAKYSERCHSEVCRAADVPGCGAALEALLSQGLPLFISSATPTGPLRDLVTARGWTGVFKETYGAPASKSDHIHAILSDGGWQPSEMVYVGDSDADMIAAAECGSHFVGICLDGPPSRFSRDPAVWLKDLSGLPRLLAEMNRRVR